MSADKGNTYKTDLICTYNVCYSFDVLLPLQDELEFLMKKKYASTCSDVYKLYRCLIVID